MTGLVERVTRDGFAALDVPTPQPMLHAFEHVFADRQAQGGAANDNANPLPASLLRFLQSFPAFCAAVRDLLGPQAVVVRTLFARLGHGELARQTWHQRVTIMARHAHPLPPGFGPLNMEAGMAHITAPQEFLAHLLVVWFYLDAVTGQHGALEISRGSHRRGRIPGNVLAMMPMVEPAELLMAQRGEVHFLRPLLLQRTLGTPSAASPRVIQLEMAPNAVLPPPLQWHTATPLLPDFPG